jgi:hypothetical protein
MKDLKYLMPKKELLMLIGAVYTAKIVQDATDDRAKSSEANVTRVHV